MSVGAGRGPSAIMAPPRGGTICLSWLAALAAPEGAHVRHQVCSGSHEAYQQVKVTASPRHAAVAAGSKCSVLYKFTA